MGLPQRVEQRPELPLDHSAPAFQLVFDRGALFWSEIQRIQMCVDGLTQPIAWIDLRGRWRIGDVDTLGSSVRIGTVRLG